MFIIRIMSEAFSSAIKTWSESVDARFHVLHNVCCSHSLEQRLKGSAKKGRTSEIMQTSLAYLWRHKVTRAFFYRYLSPKAVRHLLAIPFQALDVVLVTIEEVNFTGGLLDAWVEIQHFEQRARSTLPHADDEALR